MSGALLERPPHYARVRALLGAFDAPVVQLWGWAGTGKRAILAGLLEDEAGAKHVPAAWLREPDRLEERLAHSVGRRAALLICEAAEDDGAAIGAAGSPARSRASDCWSPASSVSTSDVPRWWCRPNKCCCGPTRSGRCGSATAGRALDGRRA